MIGFAEVEASLGLFAEGIAGRYFHLKPSSEFASRRVELAADQAASTNDTLYLPDVLQTAERLEIADFVPRQADQGQIAAFFQPGEVLDLFSTGLQDEDVLQVGLGDLVLFGLFPQDFADDGFEVFVGEDVGCGGGTGT